VRGIGHNHAYDVPLQYSITKTRCRSCIGMKAFQKGHKTYASLYIGMVLECKSHFTGEMYNILACENRVSDHFI
jgi:hypothetical protein